MIAITTKSSISVKADLVYWPLITVHPYIFKQERKDTAGQHRSTSPECLRPKHGFHIQQAGLLASSNSHSLPVFTVANW